MSGNVTLNVGPEFDKGTLDAIRMNVRQPMGHGVGARYALNRI